MKHIEKHGPTAEQSEALQHLQNSRSERQKAAALEAAREKMLYALPPVKIDLMSEDSNVEEKYKESDINPGSCALNETSVNNTNLHKSPLITIEGQNIALNDTSENAKNKDKIIFDAKQDALFTTDSEPNSIIDSNVVHLDVKDDTTTCNEIIAVEDGKHAGSNKSVDDLSDDDRSKLVAESLSIYRATLAKGAKTKKQYNTVLPPRLYNENPMKEQNKPPKIRGDFNWNQSEDLFLSKLVHECLFDFEMIASMMSREFPLIKELFTPDRCRIRWSELDIIMAEKDRKHHIEKKAKIFKSNGKQVSFEELKRRAFAEPCESLCKPKDFPNMLEPCDEDSDYFVFDTSTGRQTMLSTLSGNAF